MGSVLKGTGVTGASALVFAATFACGLFTTVFPSLAQQAQSAEGAQDTRATFPEWLKAVAAEAQAKGIKPATVAAAFKGLRLNRRVIALDNHQPEFVSPVGAYVAARTTAETLRVGRLKRRQHAALFSKVEKAYGVPARYIVAIWRLESGYGANFGSFRVVEALATLAYAGGPKRRLFWRQQLLAALEIADKGYVPLRRLVGSWAGAMGQTQFIPTTYLAHAVDFDGDGRRDLWRSLPDVFGSTANYLKTSGWKPGLPFGWEVRLPKGFDYGQAHIKGRKPVAEWTAMGVKLASGKPLPAIDGPVSLVVPSGWRGPVFLVTANYRAILRYNNASAYALTVGLLAERLVGRGKLAAAWPANDRLLRRAEKTELQQKLIKLGYDPGPVDGKVGPSTRKAIRAFQKKAGKPADGYANYALLEAVRSAVAQ